MMDTPPEELRKWGQELIDWVAHHPMRWVLEECERADYLVVNPYKWLFYTHRS
jgi:hypothetical protein